VKPDWKDAPEWANWLAMDEDGSWYWYESEPEANTYLQAWLDKPDTKLLQAGDVYRWTETKEAKPS
jgi:hypothetical protein